MTDNIVDLSEARTRIPEQKKPARPASLFPDQQSWLEQERRHRLFWHLNDLAKAGDAEALKKLAEYAVDCWDDVRSVMSELGHARRVAAGRKHGRKATPDPTRPWDVQNEGGVTVSGEIEANLETTRLLLTANQPAAALEAINRAQFTLKHAMERCRVLQRAKEKRERERLSAERNREKLERERQRIERKLATLAEHTS